MKSHFLILSAVYLTAGLFLSGTVSAQAPEKISYQAVIRNSSGQLVTNTQIGMQISILQGTYDGTVVYREVQTPATNANGLISIEIGGGTVVSGDFATTDWANGSYFIKTETDLLGGVNYTISGTSQLLSVPYALHAKTAGTVTGTITENDPVYSASVASGITASDTAVWNHKVDTLIAGIGITISGTGTTGCPYIIGATDTLAIGDSYQGGIVFWLDATGRHGLIAAIADQSTGIQWYNGTNRYTGTTGDGLYAGAMNTTMIVSTQLADNPTGNFAAKVCADYSVTAGDITYGDWYLPSIYELNLLYLQKDVVGNFASDSNNYWSSTETADNTAWRRRIDIEYQSGNTGKSSLCGVRAIRAF